MAQRVIHHRLHVLDVDGKKYKLTVTEHCEDFTPDQVDLAAALHNFNRYSVKLLVINLFFSFLFLIIIGRLKLISNN